MTDKLIVEDSKIKDLKIKPIYGLQKNEGIHPLFDIAESVAVYHSTSDINGIGVFTPMDININQFIGVSHVFYKGFWYMTTHGNYNHSENPNCIVEVDNNVLFLKAIIDIEHGKELTVDYRKQPFLEQPGEDWIKWKLN